MGWVSQAFRSSRQTPPLLGEWVNPQGTRKASHRGVQSGSGVLGAFFAQPDAGAFPVFVNKDHPGSFKRGTDGGYGLVTRQTLAFFKINQCRARNSSCLRNFTLFFSDKGAGGSALGWRHAKSDLKSEYLSDMVSDITTHRNQSNDQP